ncbi:hypothetical protein [Silvanigrella sp.]|jgi:hypothetical protein|uniref:hypothetical protein n=1 Tax=Silvanigrella sp. TaxID=2024976 RepID=UPI0037CAD636
MKIHIIILINTLSFSIKVYSNSLNSLDMFLPKDNIGYEVSEESDVSVKSRYEKIEGDLNIYPTKDYLKDIKKPNYRYDQNIHEQCNFPSFKNNYSIKFKDGVEYSKSYSSFENQKIDPNNYSIKFKDGVEYSSFENQKINPNIYENKEKNNDDINQLYYKKYIYRSDNDIEICPPIHPLIR